MAQFAADADRQLQILARIGRSRSADGARDREIAVAVGHFDDLRHDAARRAEGGMDVPARADAAKARERERRPRKALRDIRSEEHTSELQSLLRISYAVSSLKKKKKQHNRQTTQSCQEVH